MTAAEILNELKPLGSDSYKRVIFKHGVAEPCYGVKIGDMQKIVKRIKKDYKLALALYDSGVYDAMYLAGLLADDEKMTKKDLKHWLKGAYCRPLAGWTVAWVAAGSPHGWELALEWIDSKESLTAVAGWATLASIVSVKADDQLDLAALKKLIARVQESIHQEADDVRYHMNTFLISLGSYVEPLKDTVLKAADKIGPVTADLGDNDCKTPSIAEYIAKVEKRGAIGKKRKTAKC
jgi:3-methyladenine DNA glycosylase AlkD